MIEADLRTLLDRIETKLDQIINQRQLQDYYSTSDIAEILKRSEFTVRQWCRLRRVHAEKRPCGRGRSQEWIILHSELQRIQSEGLLPLEH
jgi:DNA-directed RNA polymerase specialized sigma24 family protein